MSFVGRLKFIIFTMMLIFSITNRGFSYVKPSSKNGVIKFQNHLVDFGQVTRGKQLEYKFVFENIGNGPLQVQAVHSTCGCTIVDDPGQKVYQPGEQSFIKVVFNTESFVGSVAKTVSIMTNDKLHPSVLLSVKANIIAEFMADPPVVDFGEVDKQDSYSRQVILKPINGFSLSVIDLNYNRDLFDVSYSKVSGGKWVVKITLKPPTRIGLIKENIYVVNNSKTMPRLKLVVRGDVKGPIKLTPEYVEFGAVGKEKQSRRLIKLTGSQVFKLSQSAVELSINGEQVPRPEDFLSLSSAKEDKKNSTGLVLTLKNKSRQSGNVQGRLILKTSLPIQKEVSFNFFGFFL